ncbi:MAG: NAD(P)-dependent oxidoreductase [Candidatus Peribacteraceae bacterium]
MKRVLVTGASGFIGRQSLPFLVQNGYEVHAVSSGTKEIVKVKGVTWQAANLLDEDERSRVMNQVKPTHVLHFAWIATPGEYWTSPLNEEWVEATVDLLRLAKEHGVKRFVGAGSSAEYDWATDAPHVETETLKPATPYGMAKAEAGTMVYNESMSTAWGRIFHLYGPYEDGRRLVPDVIKNLLEGKEAACTHGAQVRDFLHVRDTASAFVSLLESDVTGAVNIASGTPVTIKQVVETIGRLIGKPELITLGKKEAPKNDPAVLTADTTRLRTEIGWQPSMTLEDGLNETIEWWKAE